MSDNNKRSKPPTGLPRVSVGPQVKLIAARYVGAQCGPLASRQCVCWFLQRFSLDAAVRRCFGNTAFPAVDRVKEAVCTPRSRKCSDVLDAALDAALAAQRASPPCIHIANMHLCTYLRTLCDFRDG